VSDDARPSRTAHSKHSGVSSTSRRLDSVPTVAGPPRTLTAEQYERAKSILEHGLAQPGEALFDAVRGCPAVIRSASARCRAFEAVRDVQVRIVGESDNEESRVLLPRGLSSGPLRLPLQSAGRRPYELVWLQEEIATGSPPHDAYDSPAPAEERSSGLACTEPCSGRTRERHVEAGAPQLAMSASRPAQLRHPIFREDDRRFGLGGKGAVQPLEGRQDDSCNVGACSGMSTSWNDVWTSRVAASILSC